jgi:YidC/Oxa1 family membrane protein insertase
MDRNTVIGFVLIGVVLMIWMYTMAPPPQQTRPHVDTTSAPKSGPAVDTIATSQRVPQQQQSAQQDTLGKFFSHLLAGSDRTVTIETPLYSAVLSTRGGGIKSWTLKQYKTWDQHLVRFLDLERTGDFGLLFYTSDGRLVNTKSLVFDIPNTRSRNISIAEGDSITLEFVLNVGPGRRIVKSLVFHGDSYSFDATYRFEGMENIIANFEYQVVWESGIRYFEYNSVDESRFAHAAAYAGGELTELDASKPNEVVKQNISGRVSWVGARNKYFAVALIPREKESQGAYMEGTRELLPNNGARELYSIGLRMPFVGRTSESDRFTVFMGPLDFDIVKSYNVGLDQFISLGAAWIIRPISQYIILPLFKFLRSFIPNYGIVLIVFAFIVKVVLHPLTKTSMRSMQRMQALSPRMNEIREKYKDDPQKMNQQIMRLYKEYGVNPAGGCLPMLLQLPILYALWSVFSSTIELRQASFVWWIHDLSVPDIVLHLPFHIPLFGNDTLSGLALLMGITMFIQQKMSIKDPRQKMMVWMMPLLMTLLFNGFPAGLNLYYFVFNVLTIGQQAWINKQHKGDPLKKVSEKKRTGGIMNRLSRNLPKVQKR